MRKTCLQNLKKLVQVETSWETLEQDDHQIFQENRLRPNQRRPLHTCIQKEKTIDYCWVYVNVFLPTANQNKAMQQIKKQLSDEFNMKDLREAKTIIEQEITKDLYIKTLKIDQKVYIRDLLESKKMSFCHPIVFPIKVLSTIPMDQVDDNVIIDLSLY